MENQTNIRGVTFNTMLRTPETEVLKWSSILAAAAGKALLIYFSGRLAVTKEQVFEKTQLNTPMSIQIKDNDWERKRERTSAHML